MSGLSLLARSGTDFFLLVRCLPAFPIIGERQKRQTLPVFEISLTQAGKEECERREYKHQTDENQNDYDIHASLLPLKR